MADLFRHDFNKNDYTTLPWAKTGAGTATLALTAAANEWLTAGQAMKLTTSTVASEPQEVHLYMARSPNQDVVTFGGVFSIQDENLSNIAFYLGWRDGVTWWRSKLLHNYSTNVWQYDAGETGSQTLTTLLTRDANEVTSVGRWHRFEMTADFRNNRHVNTTIDEKEFSTTVSAKLLRSSADASTPAFMYDFAIETTNLGGTPSASVIIFDQLWAYSV